MMIGRLVSRGSLKVDVFTYAGTHPLSYAGVVPSGAICARGRPDRKGVGVDMLKTSLVTTTAAVYKWDCETWGLWILLDTWANRDQSTHSTYQRDLLTFQPVRAHAFPQHTDRGSIRTHTVGGMDFMRMFLQRHHQPRVGLSMGSWKDQHNNRGEYKNMCEGGTAI